MAQYSFGPAEPPARDSRRQRATKVWRKEMSEPLGAPFLAHTGIEYRIEDVYNEVHQDGRDDDEQ
jgi:hypothetical protein